MKKLKILLGDPRHYTVGTHSNFVPIGIGYIGSFLKQEIKDVDIELKLEVDAEEIFSTIDKWKPDVVGLSNYLWNASLSNLICDYAKKLNPEILITESCISYNLYDDHTVNNLSVDDIFKKYIEASNNFA